MFPIRVKTVQESDLRMLGSLARNIQRVLPVTQADIDAAAALGKGWVVWKVFEVSDPLDNLRGGTQLIIRQNSIQPGQNVRRVIFVAGPSGQTVVIRGTDYIVLPDAIANSLSYVKAFGGTEQNGTPTPDTPMDIVSNNGVLKHTANIANVNAQTVLVGYYVSASGVVSFDANNWMYQDYIPVSPNTTYTLTMSSLVYFVSISEYSTASDSGFIVRDASGSGAHTQFTITTGVNTNFIRFGANLDRSEVTLEKVLAINWMLNKGNSMPYTPYGPMGVYADGTVETIQVHGTNVFNKNATDALMVGFPAADGKWNASAGFVATCCKLLEGETYTITRVTSTPTSSAMRVIAYDKVPTANYYGTPLFIGTNAIKTATITVPTGSPYIVTYVKHSTDSITDQDLLDGFQIEFGSTATDYAPYYNGGTATTEMLLKVGNYQDVQSILDGVVTRNVGVKVLDGTEDWAFRNQSLSLFYATIADTYFDDNQANHLALSTHFLGMAVINTSMPDNSCKCASLAGTNSLQLFVKSTNFAAPEDIKSWLAAQYAAGTPVIVIYPLETPTTESVAGQTLQVTDGDNIVEITQASLSGLKLEAEYTKVA